MKKMMTAILVFDLMAGLLFLGLWEERNFLVRKQAQLETGEDVLSGQAVRADGELQDEKKIAITFDDGPHPTYTEELLDGLKERDVRATFFVTGEHAQLHPDIIRRMQEEGHLIGNHTYSHIQLTAKNRETFCEELIRTNEVIEAITGEEVLYVRPPYGSWDKSLEKELNMFPVLWTVDPLDWSLQNTEAVTARILDKAQENSIILLHDYYETSVEAALCSIDILKEEGYSFVTVDEILFD
jgi:peptidoglycan/xylan/chitin deacetylase (PgdA/CDA1 family)